MAQVPIEDIMEHVDSKYRLVIVAAKRAKQLNRGAGGADPDRAASSRHIRRWKRWPPASSATRWKT